MRKYHPRSKEYRLQQLLRYLESKYTTPYPVNLVFTREPMDQERASTERDGRVLNISINLRLDSYSCLDAILHEFAHAMSWRHDRMERAGHPIHGPDWGICYAELWTDLFEEDPDGELGVDRSKKF